MSAFRSYHDQAHLLLRLTCHICKNGRNESCLKSLCRKGVFFHTQPAPLPAYLVRRIPLRYRYLHLHADWTGATAAASHWPQTIGLAPLCHFIKIYALDTWHAKHRKFVSSRRTTSLWNTFKKSVQYSAVIKCTFLPSCLQTASVRMCPPPHHHHSKYAPPPPPQPQPPQPPQLQIF